MAFMSCDRVTPDQCLVVLLSQIKTRILIQFGAPLFITII